MKLILKILAALVIVLVLAVAALLFFFDPNVLKPRIEAAAAEQGVALRIEGDLGWQLWPSLGVEVNRVRVAALAEPDQPIAQVERASLLLALRPLFRGEVEVHHIIVEGAAVNLRVDSAGRGNWETLVEGMPAEGDRIPAPEAPVVEPGERSAVIEDVSDDEPLLLNVAKISVRDSAFDYRDDTSGQQLSLSEVNLELNNFNLQGDPFDLQLSWQTRIVDPEQTLLLAGDLRQRVYLTEDMSQVRLPDGRLTLTLGEGRDSVTLDTRYSITLTDPQGEMSYSGTVALAEFSPKALLLATGGELPETAEDYALTRLSLETGVSGTAQSLTLSPLRIQLDRTLLLGDLAVSDFEAAAIELTLQGDQINVDHYLPPPEPDAPVPEPEATGDEILIPLETVRALNARASLDFDQLVIAGMALSDIRVRLRAEDGLVTLERADATAYQGAITSNATMNARGDTAVIDFNGRVDRLQLAPLMSDMELDENIQLSGAINAEAVGATRGLTYNQLMAALTAETQFSGVQVRSAPLNIEEQFCRLVNLISQVEGSDRDWPAYTEMRQLQGKATVADRVITVESFSAGVEQLLMNMRGTLNMESGDYDFTLPLTLRNESTSEDGCTVASNYWIDRSLSLLRCRGTLEELNPLSDCRPDRRGMESLARDLAEHRLRQQHGERVDEEAERLRQRLRERLGDEEQTEELENRLRGLLRGR